MFKLYMVTSLSVIVLSAYGSIQERLDQNIDKIEEIRGLVSSDHFESINNCSKMCKTCSSCTGCAKACSKM